MADEEQFGLGDFFVIAEAVLGVSAEAVMLVADIGLAESAINAPHASFDGVVLYEDPVERAAVLGARIVKNHALLDGNKRVGLIAMRSEIARLGYTWTAAGNLEVADFILALADNQISEREFIAWVKANALP